MFERPGEKTAAGTVAAKTIRLERPEDIVFIGAAAILRGDITGKADIAIGGRVEGIVDLPDNDANIAETGETRGGILANNVNIRGTVKGDVQARRKVTVFATGYVEGLIAAPRLKIEDGTKLNGRIDICGAPAPPPVKPTKA